MILESNLINNLWVEKYRPKSLSELILDDEYRNEFKYYIDNKEIPHLLLVGLPGGGKSALAGILCSKNGIIENINDNLLPFNGSSKENRGINFISNLESFMKSPPVGNDKIKIIWIEEGDMLTEEAFNAIRAMLEKYSLYTRFLFTCNYQSKIPDPIKSRLRIYKFKQMSSDYILNLSKNILNNEKIEYIDDDILNIINKLYPDIRKIIDTLQRYSLQGKLIYKNEILDIEKKIIDLILELITKLLNIDEKNKLIINNIINNIIELIMNNDIDYRSLYYNLFNTKNINVPIKILINKYSKDHLNCLIPEMNFISLIYDIVLCIKQYQSNIMKG